MLGLLYFFRPGSVLQFQKIGAGVCGGSICLLVLRPEFVIFQTNQNLALVDLVPFFHADPLHPASNFGIQVDLVMRDDVSAGGEHHTADFATLCRGANDFDFWGVVRKQAIAGRDRPSSTNTPIPIRM